MIDKEENKENEEKISKYVSIKMIKDFYDW